MLLLVSQFRNFVKEGGLLAHQNDQLRILQLLPQLYRKCYGEVEVVVIAAAGTKRSRAGDQATYRFSIAKY